MNTLFNSALRQSASLRKDLDAFADAPSASPALLGQISASLTSFSRTVDDYSKLAKQEIVAAKQEKAFERVKTFRNELSDYRDQFSRLKQDSEARATATSSSELYGRRPHNTATPENPYSDSSMSASASMNTPWRPSDPSSSNPYHNERENHAIREHGFMSSTNAQLDEFLDRGRTVLGDLGTQREMLEGTKLRLGKVATTLGISQDTIRMVERRARQDKWIFWAGVIIFFLFCYFVLRWLR